jgi:ankyrin repeat protein
MEKLITFGAKIDSLDDTGSTPLMHATHYNSIDSVKFLLDRGANFNIKNDKGETALDIALEQSKKWRDIDGNNRSAIERKCNNIKILKALGAEVEDFIDDFDKNGNAMIHYASSQGNVGTIKFLLENGAKADIKNLEGETPSDIAKKKDNSAVLDLLRNSIKDPSQSAESARASTFTTAAIGGPGRGN